MSFSSLWAAEPYDGARVRDFLTDSGFTDAGRGERLIRSLAKAEVDQRALAKILDDLVEGFSRSAEPERALLNFTNLADWASEIWGSRAALFRQLEQEPEGLLRLCRLLGFSQALADFLVRQPRLLGTILQTEGAVSRPALRKRARQAARGVEMAERLNGLRRFRQEQTLRIGLLDLESDTWRDERDFRLVVEQISDLAAVCIQVTLEILTEGNTKGFAVIIMGKGGARELNYSSDVDLIFLAEDRMDSAEVGQALLRAIGDISPSGQLWRVDMRLRPDGGSGSLVTPISYALSYYESYAAAWEWQALIKARVIAGDAKLGRRFRKFTRSITWARRTDDAHLHEVYEMKRRSEATNDGSDQNNVKQGPGGIRDAEWVVQQMQMMVGPTHPRARAAATLRALPILEEFDALAPDEVRRLRDGYLWLRVAEHRLQLLNEQAIRNIPAKEADKTALARRLGCPWRGAAAATWLDEEHVRHRHDVRALCEKIFWTFQQQGHEDWEVRLPADISQDGRRRLDRLAHGTQTQPLPAPLSRQVRAVLPGALVGLERAANPERALANFENLCESSGNRLSLLKALSGSPHLSHAVFTILGGSQSLTDTLLRYPELLDFTANRNLLAQGRTFDEARAECRAYCLTFRDRGAAIRRWRGREMLRIGLRDLLMDVSPHEITREISALANASLDLAVEEVRNQLRPSADRIAFAVIGMGKFGGREMHYASDCDVVFAYRPMGENLGGLALKFAETLVALLGGRTEDGLGFELDARLRPHGASGLLASTIDSFREYFQNPKLGFAVWERQALTRARFVAGDGSTGSEVVSLMREAAFPAEWNPEWGDELRHMKARMEKERAGKGKSVYDVKLGVGALSDIEWTGQWLALKYGHENPELRAANTRRQLAGAQAAGLLSAEEYGVLDGTYGWLRRAELRLQVAKEGATSAVKRDSTDFKVWAKAVFPGLEDAAAVEQFEREWEERTVGSRGVFERVREGV